MQGGVGDAVLVQGGGEDVEHVGPRGEHQGLGRLVLGPDPQQTPADTTWPLLLSFFGFISRALQSFQYSMGLFNPVKIPLLIINWHQNTIAPSEIGLLVS